MCDNKIYTCFCVKCRYSCPILMKLVFSRIFSKSIQISNSKKIRPVRTELFHVDRRTDMTKLIAAYRSFENAPKTLSIDSTIQ